MSSYRYYYNETGIKGQSGSLGPINTGNPLMGGGGVDLSSMANVNTTNNNYGGNKEPIGYALAFTKTKRNTLGYAVS